MKFRFDNGPVLAASLSVLLLLWMGSGYVGGQGQDSAENPLAQTRTLERGTVRVQVRTLQAQPIDHLITLHGTTQPDRAVTLRAEAAGTVERILVGEGSQVTAQAMLLELAQGDLPARLKYTQDLVVQRELEFTGAQRLRQQNLLSEAGLAEARAELSNAQADLRGIQERLAHTRITAPFAGTLDTWHIEVGDYVRSGDAIARILNFQPTLVVGHVSENEGMALTAGMAGEGALLNETKLSGRVRHVSAEADAQSRTYRVEFELDANPDWQPVAGGTARIDIRMRSVLAHRLSPALLTLDQAGRLGVKVVDDEQRARFMPVQLVRASMEGAWVSGLPERVQLITVGAGFVKDGDAVQVVVESSTAEAAAG